MADSIHAVHPAGDIILTLKNHDAEFATWDSNFDKPPATAAFPVSEGVSDSAPKDALTGEKEDANEDETTSGSDENQDIAPKMRVSSMHLRLASGYFNKMLDGRWEEGAGSTVDAEGWDSNAMLIVMNAIHGHVRKVPSTVSLEMLAKIAVIVDYYDYLEAIETFSQKWIGKLAKPSVYGRDVVFWICICLVFRVPDAFRIMTKIAIKGSRGPIQTMGLPIPQEVVNKLETKRQEVTGSAMDAIYAKQAELCVGGGCMLTCRAMQLRVLMIWMHMEYLDRLQPESAFLGWNIEFILEELRKIDSPKWDDATRGGGNIHRCTLTRNLVERISEVAMDIRGLELADFGISPSMPNKEVVWIAAGWQNST
ncbi:hypothetical protein K469DRAFT_578253 [Zopfia rhizophila CBS 207.26]|uniref:BTB domain-containing protein n=1 Tax=Zopfia rhizophila CBS 207.26 TaxID=1314779 RepID=A0A6A6E1D8_9PEZI|nr:hypothetical protein K469DRAFT_578253 [Zopfia rhizophila CBS 207.26]